MKSNLWSIAVLVAVLACGHPAAAQDETPLFSSPEDAVRNIPPLDPKRCLDEAGTNTCIALPLMAGDPPDSVWFAVWRPADTPTECIDRTSGELAECGAPGAVLTHASPGICIRNADGTTGECRRSSPGGWGSLEMPLRPAVIAASTPAQSVAGGGPAPHRGSPTAPPVFQTPEEALANMPEPNPRCFDDAGVNRCNAVPLLVGDPANQLWSPVWGAPDHPLECIERTTGDALACDVPGAVRTLGQIQMLAPRVVGPDGQPIGPPMISPVRAQWGFPANGGDDD